MASLSSMQINNRKHAANSTHLGRDIHDSFIFIHSSSSSSVLFLHHFPLSAKHTGGEVPHTALLDGGSAQSSLQRWLTEMGQVNMKEMAEDQLSTLN